MATVCVIGLVVREEIKRKERVLSQRWGGSGLYAAIAASKFAETHLISVVGRDFDLNNLKSLGISTQHVSVSHGKTPSIRVDLDSFGWDLIDRTSITAIPEISASQFDVLVLANCDPAWQNNAIKNIRVKYTMADSNEDWLQSHTNEFQRVAYNSDLVCLTTSEWQNFERHQKRYSVMSILKNGSKGIQIQEGETIIDLPSPNLSRVLDDTGAGDVMLGAMAGWLAINANLDAINIATLVKAYRAAQPIIAEHLSDLSRIK